MSPCPQTPEGTVAAPPAQQAVLSLPLFRFLQLPSSSRPSPSVSHPLHHSPSHSLSFPSYHLSLHPQENWAISFLGSHTPNFQNSTLRNVPRPLKLPGRSQGGRMPFPRQPLLQFAAWLSTAGSALINSCSIFHPWML